MVTFVHYPTESGPRSGERFLDNVTLEGPIPVMVRDTLAAIRRNMSRRAVITDVGRQDVWDYPETALREAVVNALVHRDLSGEARGTQVQVEMYPDRLAIRSPGGLFGPVTIETLGEEGISSARNATLIRLLEEVSLPGETRTVCENRGSGIRAMLDSLLSAGMSPPHFSDKISSFLVTFPSTATGVDSRVATAELRDLVARELITQTGTRRWAHYQLVQRPSATRTPAPRADRRPEILAALGDESLSRADLVERTGLSDQTVRRWLKIMRDEQAIEIVGDAPRSKRTRYRRARQEPLFPGERSPH